MRSYRPEDAPLLAKYANNAGVTAHIREPGVREYTVDEAVAWIDLLRAPH